MQITEIIRDTKPEAVSFLAGVEFTDDTSHNAIGIREETGQNRWLAVVVNYDAEEDSPLDEEAEKSDKHPADFYIEKYPSTEKYEP